MIPPWADMTLNVLGYCTIGYVVFSLWYLSKAMKKMKRTDKRYKDLMSRLEEA